MSVKRRARRHHVAVRPKVRSQRLRQLGAIGTVGCLSLLAALTLRQFKHEGASWSWIQSRLAARLQRIQVSGAPAPLSEDIAAYLDSSAAGNALSAGPEELMRQFPCLKQARLSKNYFQKRVDVDVELRSAVAVAQVRGRPAGFLDTEGVVFAAPANLYPIQGPSVDVSGAPETDLKALAQAVPIIAKPGAFESPLQAMSYVSAQDGWQVRLADGTSLMWGDLRFTREKITRLREILADARSQFGGTLNADMRYFEDGRVLLKPAPAGRALSVR